uniref:COX6C domain-containing protein n=1 Tax=Strongyloides venezuelensis TaxID=75913 RepID=A0A0K0FC34_STRVS
MVLVMRNMMQTAAKRTIYFGLAGGIVTTITFYVSYVQPRQKKFEQFFANYDPYQRMREICESGNGYLHTCPDQLAAAYQEKNIPIGSKPQLVAESNVEDEEESIVVADE